MVLWKLEEEDIFKGNLVSAQHYIPVRTENFWSDQYNIGAQIQNGDANKYDVCRVENTDEVWLYDTFSTIFGDTVVFKKVFVYCRDFATVFT